MDIIRIGGPHKIVYHGCLKVPREGLSLCFFHFCSGRFIAMADLLWILQVTCSPYGILFIQGDLYVKIAPYTVEFTGYVRSGMPPLKIVFRQFWIPLAHGKCHSFATVSTTPPDL